MKVLGFGFSFAYYSQSIITMFILLYTVATYDRWGGQISKIFMSNFLRI